MTLESTQIGERCFRGCQKFTQFPKFAKIRTWMGHFSICCIYHLKKRHLVSLLPNSSSKSSLSFTFYCCKGLTDLLIIYKLQQTAMWWHCSLLLIISESCTADNLTMKVAETFPLFPKCRLSRTRKRPPSLATVQLQKAIWQIALQINLPYL